MQKVVITNELVINVEQTLVYIRVFYHRVLGNGVSSSDVSELSPPTHSLS